MLNIDDRLIKEISPKIGPNALSVLLAISIHLNQKTGRCFPSHALLMHLTGMGKNAVYEALKTLKNEGLLRSEQSVDSANKQFGRRVFRVTTRFIKIFVDAQDAEPLPENREPENREPENREPENRETYQINNREQINNMEQINNREGVTPAQILETLEEKTDVANNIGGPGWSEFPKAKTPGELANELRRFYAARPEEFRMTKDATPAQNWPAEKVTQVVNGFCDWAIAEGWERRTFQQINARLKRWFKDEQQYASKTPGPVSGYAAPPNLKTA